MGNSVLVLKHILFSYQLIKKLISICQMLQNYPFEQIILYYEYDFIIFCQFLIFWTLFQILREIFKTENMKVMMGNSRKWWERDSSLKIRAHTVLVGV